MLMVTPNIALCLAEVLHNSARQMDVWMLPYPLQAEKLANVRNGWKADIAAAACEARFRPCWNASRT